MAPEHSAVSPVQPVMLRTEYLENPLGIDARRPRLGWQLAADGRGVMQMAYQVQVAVSPARLASGDNLLWDSGKVLSGNSTGVDYQGADLRSRRRYFWHVRSWDQEGRPSSWSEPAWWEMGLLAPTEWRGEWVEVEWEEDPRAFNPSPFFRRAFVLDRPVKSARLYITAHGLYEAWLNGARVGDQVFTPGYTAYDKRLQYQVYDVADLLQPGSNAIGAILGDGWYRGKVYVSDNRNVYGDRLGLLAMLVVEHEDGGESVIATDGAWKATTGPIRKSDMKDGEVYDARLEIPGWNTPGFDDSRWGGVRIAAHPKHTLIASMGVPVRRKETFRPKEILTTPKGETVIDFGQNIAGVVRMKVRGAQGTEVHLQHGEALDKDGNFTVAHLFATPPKEDNVPEFQEVSYTLRGGGEESYEPRFTVHGFRYVKVEGYPGKPDAGDFEAVAIYSDMPVTGAFECSDPLLTQLHRNVVWSMKGNFLDIPTDCPTRERAGWTGDAQLFTPSASFLMDTRAFFHKWLKDLTVEQFPDGKMGNFVPNPYRLSNEGLARMFRFMDGSSGWGDVAVMTPWALFWAYGDTRFLEEQYASMKAWVEFVRMRATRVNWLKRLGSRYRDDAEYRARQQYIWETGYHWGEWLEPGEGGPLQTGIGMAQRTLFGAGVVATAYYAHSARLLSYTAALLGKAGDAYAYGLLADEVKAAYAAEFIGADGRIEPDKQASYVRVLAFDLAPAHLKPVIVGHLVRLIRAAGNHVGTGFLSTVYLCQVLADNGHLDVAYDLLTQRTIPSWLYAVTRGATTIWETWEGIREDGTPQLSLNHYSPGAVVNFLHRTVAGIAADAPGYRRILIAPRPGGGLTWASASYQSAYGLIQSKWTIENGRMRLAVAIPPNTQAVVRLPGAAADSVLERGVPLGDVVGVTGVEQLEQDITLAIGSGEYSFEYPMR